MYHTSTIMENNGNEQIEGLVFFDGFDINNDTHIANLKKSIVKIVYGWKYIELTDTIWHIRHFDIYSSHSYFTDECEFVDKQILQYLQNEFNMLTSTSINSLLNNQIYNPNNLNFNDLFNEYETYKNDNYGQNYDEEMKNRIANNPFSFILPNSMNYLRDCLNDNNFKSAIGKWCKKYGMQFMK